MAIDEVVTLILLLQNLQRIWCDNILILSQLIRQMKPYHNSIHDFVIKYCQGFSLNGQFLPWSMMKTSFSEQAL